MTSMLEVSDIPALRHWRDEQRRAGRRVALVPTMGSLHEGHLALVDEARRRADSVVLSVFVNPLQFGPDEDFARYPRNLERDRGLAGGRGVDLFFAPETDALVPAGAEIRVIAGETAERWEGSARPGHFTGVLTIVAKLFHLVEPEVACFGQKDIQQATLIRTMTRDLNWSVELAIVPIMREADGLAMSSRNVYLSPTERTNALSLSHGLRAARDAWQGGERSAAVLKRIVQSSLRAAAGVRAEYIAVVEPEKLRPVSVAPAGTILAVAARVGTTRLIDNVILA
ncbi:MAG TPA: pantoate--beta-alanine ligase [Gemmatimonadales bacterium]|jgi:pantoate--beta-alanine ligase|nr:pantoate--beta-alanine ligase [Gemmatimonadales bacterium]